MYWEVFDHRKSRETGRENPRRLHFTLVPYVVSGEILINGSRVTHGPWSDPRASIVTCFVGLRGNTSTPPFPSCSYLFTHFTYLPSHSPFIIPFFNFIPFLCPSRPTLFRRHNLSHQWKKLFHFPTRNTDPEIPRKYSRKTWSSELVITHNLNTTVRQRVRGEGP